MRWVKFSLFGMAAIAGPAFASPVQWTISEASSGVTVSHQGSSKAAVRGEKVQTGDKVITGPNARAVLVRGEEYAIVAPNTRLEIADPAKSGGLWQIVESAGNIVFSIKKKLTPHFGVQTPYLAAVVKGTTFSVTVDGTGASVQVVEGAVEVSTLDGGARDLILPGAIATVGAADHSVLKVQGETTKSIKSPNAPPAPNSSEATPDSIPSPTGENSGDAAQTSENRTGGAQVIAQAVDTAAAADFSGKIGRPERIDIAISEDRPSMAKISDGLIADSPAMAAAVSSAAITPTDRAIDAEAPGKAGVPSRNENGNSGNNGNGNGNSGNSGNGNGNGNSGNNGNGNGSGNSGNNGNGNGNGNSGNSGNGNGNGNSGNNGNGNGNGNSGNSGNGNGSGNSGNSGNGNGNGNSGNSGNGNGNGNSGNSGNGNGNGNSGNSGNGNGSGNSGNSGNGNGNGNSGNSGNGNGNANSGNSGNGDGNGNSGNNGNGNGNGNSGNNGKGNGNAR